MENNFSLFQVSDASANRVCFPIAVATVIGAASPNHTVLSQNSMILMPFMAVAWAMQLLFHSGGDVLQPAEVG